MSELRTLDQATIAKLVLTGDMKALSDAQKVDYYAYRCQQAGLDPAAKPFDILTLNGKMILYANASCAQQLTSIHKLSHEVTGRELVDGVYCVFCRVSGPDGRSTENMGAVPVEGLKGEAKANAMLKATTKAIRRAVLAHMGLGMMDETEVEVETIPGVVMSPAPPAIVAPIAQPWDTGAHEEFAILEDRLYDAFKAAGALDRLPDEQNKWRSRRTGNEPSVVLAEMLRRVEALEAAAKKKADESAA
jgi:hypothetical protein